jgi:hypothetical protein
VIGDALGQAITMPVRLPPRCDATCLNPAIGGVHREGAQTGMTGSICSTVYSKPLNLADLVWRAVHRVLGAHPVVTADEDDQRIVDLAESRAVAKRLQNQRSATRKALPLVTFPEVI